MNFNRETTYMIHTESEMNAGYLISNAPTADEDVARLQWGQRVLEAQFMAGVPIFIAETEDVPEDAIFVADDVYIVPLDVVGLLPEIETFLINEPLRKALNIDIQQIFENQPSITDLNSLSVIIGVVNR